MEIKKNAAIMIGLQASAKLALDAGISGAGFSEMASVAFSRALREGGDDLTPDGKQAQNKKPPRRETPRRRLLR